MDKKNFPDIDGLLGSIRNVTTPVGHVEASVHDKPETSERTIIGDNPIDAADSIWEAFMNNLSAYGFRERKEERKVCMIDKDIADSLDECDIDRKCRSDVINAIVRTFITVFLPKLRTYRM